MLDFGMQLIQIIVLCKQLPLLVV